MQGEKLTVGASQKLRCLTCGTVTNHQIKFIHSSTYIGDDNYDPITSVDDPEYWENREYRVWACCGCESACFEVVILSKDNSSSELEQDLPISIFYPESNAGKLLPKEFTQLSRKLQSMYDEVIISFNANLRMLCAIGLRALLEGISIDHGIAERGLEAKLEKLREGKHVPSEIVDGFYRFKLMGDESAHSLEAPKDYELRYAIVAMEELLNYLYEAKYQVEKSEHQLQENATLLSLFRKDQFDALVQHQNKRKSK